MACPICGQNCNKITPAPGAGLTIHRMSREGEKDMSKVRLAKDRYYLTADRSKAVLGSDPDAATLLVAKGSSIAPAVAEHYGIPTYEGEAVSIVRDEPGGERERMVTNGTAAKTAQNYEEMRITREVSEEARASVAGDKNYGNAGRQAALMAEGKINAQRTEAGLTPLDNSPYAANAVGNTNLREDSFTTPARTEYQEAGDATGNGSRSKVIGGDGSEAGAVKQTESLTGSDADVRSMVDAVNETEAVIDRVSGGDTPNPGESAHNGQAGTQGVNNPPSNPETGSGN